MRYNEFTWFIGKVVDNNDPEKMGRLKVRCYGFYADEVEDDKLPWAVVVSPIQSSSYQEIGYSPTGIQKGATVVGFFADGDSAQIPVVLGTIHGIPGQHDVHKLARGEGGHKKKTYHSEAPTTRYSAQYPHNHTYTGESGLNIEYDNTPNSVRYSIEHPKGSWLEYQPDGNIVQQSVKDTYRVTNNNDFVLINGNARIFVKGNANIEVKGNVDEKIDGDYNLTVGKSFNMQVGQSKTVNVAQSTTESSGGNHTVTATRIDLN